MMAAILAVVLAQVDDCRPFIRGDVDGDLRVTIADAAQLARSLRTGEPIDATGRRDALDVDDSGEIDFRDVALMCEIVHGGDGVGALAAEDVGTHWRDVAYALIHRCCGWDTTEDEIEPECTRPHAAGWPPPFDPPGPGPKAEDDPPAAEDPAWGGRHFQRQLALEWYCPSVCRR